jgi:ribosomal protein S18 acetylase RimI-like enzyme
MKRDKASLVHRPRVLKATQVTLKDGRLATIRQAVPDDAQAATDFVNIVTGENKFLLRERVTWTIDEERQTLASADGQTRVFFVAVISGRLSGMHDITRGKWSKNAHVAELAISCLPDCRGVGLGTALLSKGIAWARSVAVRKLTLHALATNERAIGLYRKMGFVDEARLRGQYIIDGEPIDDLFMALWL